MYRSFNNKKKKQKYIVSGNSDSICIYTLCIYIHINVISRYIYFWINFSKLLSNYSSVLLTFAFKLLI